MKDGQEFIINHHAVVIYQSGDEWFFSVDGDSTDNELVDCPLAALQNAMGYVKKMDADKEAAEDEEQERLMYEGKWFKSSSHNPDAWKEDR